MTGVYEVDDPHVGLAGVRAVQAPRLLLQRTLPGQWHERHQRVQRRVIEALANSKI